MIEINMNKCELSWNGTRERMGHKIVYTLNLLPFPSGVLLDFVFLVLLPSTVDSVCVQESG